MQEFKNEVDRLKRVGMTDQEVCFIAMLLTVCDTHEDWFQICISDLAKKHDISDRSLQRRIVCLKNKGFLDSKIELVSRQNARFLKFTEKCLPEKPKEVSVRSNFSPVKGEVKVLSAENYAEVLRGVLRDMRFGKKRKAELDRHGIYMQDIWDMLVKQWSESENTAFEIVEKKKGMGKLESTRYAQSCKGIEAWANKWLSGYLAQKDKAAADKSRLVSAPTVGAGANSARAIVDGFGYQERATNEEFSLPKRKLVEYFDGETNFGVHKYTYEDTFKVQEINLDGFSVDATDELAVVNADWFGKRGTGLEKYRYVDKSGNYYSQKAFANPKAVVKYFECIDIYTVPHKYEHHALMPWAVTSMADYALKQIKKAKGIEGGVQLDIEKLKGIVLDIYSKSKWFRYDGVYDWGIYMVKKSLSVYFDHDDITLGENQNFWEEIKKRMSMLLDPLDNFSQAICKLASDKYFEYQKKN